MSTAAQAETSVPHDPTPGEEYNAPEANFARGIVHVNIPELGQRHSGKVRDCWNATICGQHVRGMVTTDRQSALDRVVGTTTPADGKTSGKGAILNLLSAHWFKKIENAGIIQTHLIDVPHPNVLIAHPVTVCPVEVIVRGYMAESTSTTSVYFKYQQGRRNIYGMQFEDGLKANEKFPEPLITPTTKEDRPGIHDEELTDEEARAIVAAKFGDGSYWDRAKQAALSIFALGSEECKKKGIILVDTKYEFGLDENGILRLIDEVHTPDSSRFWYASTYEQNFQAGLPPKAFDKEMLRKWLTAHNLTKDGPIPVLDPDVVDTMARNYAEVCEMIMGEKLPPASNPQEIHDAVMLYRMYTG
jgi:phosphoribosylaminoimidazole-succinocarboxamide synthase